jgi:hypothetical protein
MPGLKAVTKNKKPQPNGWGALFYGQDFTASAWLLSRENFNKMINP